jgi:hypothetical protein
MYVYAYFVEDIESSLEPYGYSNKYFLACYCMYYLGKMFICFVQCFYSNGRLQGKPFN